MTGHELRAIRRRLRLTQVELAVRVGVTGNSLARWERGEVGISAPVERLVRILAGQKPVSTKRRTR